MLTPLILSIEPTNPTQEMRVRLTLPGLRSIAARPLRATGVRTCHVQPSPTVARPLTATWVRTCHGQPGLRSNAARPSRATKLLRSHPAADDGGRRESSTSSAMSWYFVTAAKLPQSPGDSGRCVSGVGLTFKLSRGSGGNAAEPRRSSHPDDQPSNQHRFTQKLG